MNKEENEGCETLMNLRPKNTHEKLLWERLKTKTLTEQLRQSELERGTLKSELDEFKHLMKTEQLGALILKNQSNTTSSSEKNKKIKKLKAENRELICIIARHNLKLKQDVEKT